MIGHCGIATPEPDSRTHPPIVLSANNITNNTPSHDATEATDAGASWLSFGTSTTDNGRTLNEGLLWQKESFGARSVTHDFLRGTL